MTRMSQLFSKKMIIAIALLFAMIPMSAANVDAISAQKTASMFFKGMAHQGRRMAPAAVNVRLVHTELNSYKANQAVYYIFNTDNSFIIVSGDDRANDILAYGDEPLDMNNIPAPMQFMLDGFKKQLEDLQAHPGKVVKKTSIRESGDMNLNVEPLVTALWDQTEPYNNHCPTTNGKNCVTGCCATALAMVFHYWKYPIDETPSVPAYTSYSLMLRLNELPPITFDWGNMLNRYYRGGYNEDQAEAVSWLMRYIGQAESMDYTVTGSGSTTDKVLYAAKLFGYDSNATFLRKTDYNGRVFYNDAQWAQLIQEELYANRPIVFGAHDQGGGGHEFVIDGYDAVNDLYHINWGWGGVGNSHFALNAFAYDGSTYNNFQDMVVGLEPTITEPTIQVMPAKMKMDAYVDSTVTTTFAVKGILLADDVTLTLNDDTEQFTLDTYHIDREDLNGRMKKVYVTVSFTPKNSGVHTATISFNSSDAKEVTATVYGHASLETYDPVITEINDVTLTSFSANWSDETPSKNVSSYKLELVKVPYNNLVIQEGFDATEYSGTGTTDYSSHLDELTNVPGWTASKIYRSNNNLILGASKNKGWLQTPALDTRGNNGMITVKVIAKSLSSSVTDAPLKISCGDADTTVLLNDTETEYCVKLPCAPGMSAMVKFANSTVTKRVVLCNVEVYAGDKFTPVDYDNAMIVENVTTTSYNWSGLTPGFYDLRVMAYYTDGTMSSWSNTERVYIHWPTGDLNLDGEVSLADVNRLIDAILNQDSEYALLPMVGDVNGDDEISLSDINAIIDIILRED